MIKSLKQNYCILAGCGLVLCSLSFVIIKFIVNNALMLGVALLAAGALQVLTVNLLQTGARRLSTEDLSKIVDSPIFKAIEFVLVFSFLRFAVTYIFGV